MRGGRLETGGMTRLRGRRNVEMASIPDDGPSGQFVDRDGSVAW